MTLIDVQPKKNEINPKNSNRLARPIQILAIAGDLEIIMSDERLEGDS